jgi:dimethylamine--corrinoid protein Co-methyltransferase
VGVGDPPGMAIAHSTASGMGGMRTSGDLVARMQMSRGMRIKEAKEYVADKLGVSVIDLVDPVAMTEIRQDLNLGLTTPLPGYAKGIEAKFNIAHLLGIEINSVNRFRERSNTKI